MPAQFQPVDGSDIKNGIAQADDDIHAVRADLKGLAQDTRLKMLEGDDRKEFLSGMTQDEYDTLKDLAFAMGPKGTNKLEAILQEMVALKGAGD